MWLYPVFSWGAIFRDGKLVQLVHHLDESTMLDTARFEFMDEQGRFQRQEEYLS